MMITQSRIRFLRWCLVLLRLSTGPTTADASFAPASTRTTTRVFDILQHGKQQQPNSLAFAKHHRHRNNIQQFQAFHDMTSTHHLLALRGGATTTTGSSSVAAVAPTLTVWIVPALLCALSYALYNLCIKKSSATIDPLVGGALLQIVAAPIGLLVLLVRRTMTASSNAAASSAGDLFQATSGSAPGIRWAVAAGLAVGLAELLSFIISGMGVQAMQSIPIVVGGSVLFGTVLGAVWLGEALTYKGWLGVVLIAAGIALVGMDGVGMH